MTRQLNDLHTEQVEAWKCKNRGLSDRELIQVFIAGISAIRNRSLVSLSNLTVTAVIDRILLECQERYPILSVIRNDSEGLDFKQFADQVHDFTPEYILEALQEFLLELLEVFGRITAEILTKSLHQELMTVTIQASPKDLEPEVALALGLARKNRDQK